MSGSNTSPSNPKFIFCKRSDFAKSKKIWQSVTFSAILFFFAKKMTVQIFFFGNCHPYFGFSGSDGPSKMNFFPQKKFQDFFLEKIKLK